MTEIQLTRIMGLENYPDPEKLDEAADMSDNEELEFQDHTKAIILFQRISTVLLSDNSENRIDFPEAFDLDQYRSSSGARAIQIYQLDYLLKELEDDELEVELQQNIDFLHKVVQCYKKVVSNECQLEFAEPRSGVEPEGGHQKHVVEKGNKELAREDAFNSGAKEIATFIQTDFIGSELEKRVRDLKLGKDKEEPILCEENLGEAYESSEDEEEVLGNNYEPPKENAFHRDLQHTTCYKVDTVPLEAIAEDPEINDEEILVQTGVVPKLHPVQLPNSINKCSQIPVYNGNVYQPRCRSKRNTTNFRNHE